MVGPAGSDKKLIMLDLSIVIVTHNNEETINKCLESIVNEIHKINYEVIIVDNNSKDNTNSIINKYRVKSGLKNRIFLKINKANIGFGKANNDGIQKAKGKYILLLNPDVILQNVSFNKLFEQFNNKKFKPLGVLTIDLVLKNGKRDNASHRGFPTLWRSFCYFSGLEQFFSFSKTLSMFFGGYHLLNKDFNKPHEIDSPTAAFYLTKKDLLNEVNGFDEDFFMYGEDLDLSFRIKKKGYKIIFYPFYKATHIKYQSGLKSKTSEKRNITKKYFYEAMKIFYKKHYEKKYPNFINKLVYYLIKVKKNKY